MKNKTIKNGKQGHHDGTQAITQTVMIVKERGSKMKH